MDLGKASRQRIPPPKFGKSAVIAIRGNPFTSGFNGESGQIGIGYEITFDSSLTTNIDKICQCRSPALILTQALNDALQHTILVRTTVRITL